MFALIPPFKPFVRGFVIRGRTFKEPVEYSIENMSFVFKQIPLFLFIVQLKPLNVEKNGLI